MKARDANFESELIPVLDKPSVDGTNIFMTETSIDHLGEPIVDLDGLGRLFADFGHIPPGKHPDICIATTEEMRAAKLDQGIVHRRGHKGEKVNPWMIYVDGEAMEPKPPIADDLSMTTGVMGIIATAAYGFKDLYNPERPDIIVRAKQAGSSLLVFLGSASLGAGAVELKGDEGAIETGIFTGFAVYAFLKRLQEPQVNARKSQIQKINADLIYAQSLAHSSDIVFPLAPRTSELFEALTTPQDSIIFPIQDSASANTGDA